MKRLFFCFAVWLCVALAHGQTLIDLQTGKLRSKTPEDYRQENTAMRYRAAKDSMEYQSLVVRALNALHTDSLSQAESLLKKAITLRPQALANAELHFLLGQVALATQQYGSAVERFAKCLSLQPDHVRARYEKATAEVMIGNYRAAMEQCTYLLSLTQVEYTPAEIYLLRGTAAMQAKLYTDARRDLEEVLRRTPSSEVALITLALTEHAEGRSSQAFDRLNLYLQQHPQAVRALAARAHLEAQAQQYEAALLDLDKAISIEPHNGAHYAARAEIFLATERPKAAQQDIERAVALGYPVEQLPRPERKATTKR